MDRETILYGLLVVGGLVFVIAMMIFVLNPPDAWVKRIYHKKSK
jgi:hypothetical protein